MAGVSERQCNVPMHDRRWCFSWETEGAAGETDSWDAYPWDVLPSRGPQALQRSQTGKGCRVSGCTHPFLCSHPPVTLSPRNFPVLLHEGLFSRSVNEKLGRPPTFPFPGQCTCPCCCEKGACHETHNSPLFWDIVLEAGASWLECLLSHTHPTQG